MDYRKRTHRPRAYNEPGHAHELTFSCFKRYRFLEADRACEWLAESIDRARAELKYSLWAYVFMPDHVHLIVYPQESVYDDSELLQTIKERTSRKAVKFLKENAPDWLTRIELRRGSKIEHHFWQPGRGYDRNVEESATLLKMIDYVHLNPVRKKLATRSVDWRWSSAGWFENCLRNSLRPDPISAEWLG